MGTIFFIIKSWAIFQFILIILISIFFYFTKVYVKFTNKRRERIVNKINKKLKKINKDRAYLKNSVIKFFNQNIIEFILCFRKANKRNRKKTGWQEIQVIISEKVLQPQVSLLASSKDWFNRFLATQCYEIGINIIDEDIILKLLNDDTLLVAINAAIIIVNNPTVKSINEIIDKFSVYRRVRELAFANILNSESINPHFVIQALVARLNTDKDIYKRIFIYRILNALSFSNEFYSFITQDLASDNLDLRVEVLNYLRHVDFTIAKQILLDHLNDPNYQIRATAVRLLGSLHDKSVITNVESKLRDKVWWVRINAANALLNLGSEGIIALKNQSPHVDKYAYQSAQAILKTYKNRE